jgi:glucose/arabinose dehydrogenase
MRFGLFVVALAVPVVGVGSVPVPALAGVPRGAAVVAWGTIATVAGSSRGFSGDAAMANMAGLATPVGVAVLPGGGYLIAEHGRIRRVSASGTISTVAGTGTAGFAGDGGPAIGAQLNNPRGVAVMADGGFLIADWGNHRVRRVSAAGVISTVAGTGTPGLSGDGGPATGARLALPADVLPTGDGGYLIADGLNGRVRRVSPAGVISTVAGTTPGFSGDGGPATSAQLDSPDGLALRPDGGLLVSDAHNGRVRLVSPAGVISTVAGGGPVFTDDPQPATSVALNSPGVVAVQADGGFLIPDGGRVKRVSPAGIMSTVAGNGITGSSGDGGPATAASLSNPMAVAVTPDGGYLIADAGNSRVRRVTAGGTISTDAGRGLALGDGGEGVAASQAQLDTPAGVAVLPDGGFLVADAGNSRVRRVSADGSRIITVAGGQVVTFHFGDATFAFNANLSAPSGLALLPNGDYLIVDRPRDQIRKVLRLPFETIGTVAGPNAQPRDDGAPTDFELDTPAAVAVLADGSLLVADTDNHRIRRISSGGSTITTVAGNSLICSAGDGGPATSAQLFFPAAVAVLPDGGYLIADAGNGRIRKVSATGTITTVAGSMPGFAGDGGPATSARLANPRGVAVLPGGGFVIADTGNNRIRMVAPDGTISTVAGTGSPGAAGDGGPAGSAQLDTPTSVAVLPDGGLLIVDTGNQRIRRVTPAAH